MEEEGGEINLEAKEAILLEVDSIEILQIPVAKVKIKTSVSQVMRYLINQKFSSITIKSMVIMHMNAGRDIIIIISKVKISQTVQMLPPILCLRCTLKQCL
jgi:hypothetical protein